MTFSVIVPVYNIESYIQKCVDSVLKQTFSDFELILVNDGSTDLSGNICDEFLTVDTRIKVVHKENGGLSDARNYGVDVASGDYLLFVDGDDYIKADTLKRLYNVICEKKPDVILSEGMYIVQDNQITLTKNFDKKDFEGKNGVETLRLTSRSKSNWSACGKCFKAAFWKENKFEFLKGRLAEDFQLIDKVILQAKKVEMVDAFYMYLQREGSIIHSVNKNLLYDLLANLSEWKAYLKEADLDRELVEQIYAMHAVELCHGVLGYIYLLKDIDTRDNLVEKAIEFVPYLQYSNSLECKLVKYSIWVIGLRKTCYLLAKIKKCRLRKK